MKLRAEQIRRNWVVAVLVCGFGLSWQAQAQGSTGVFAYPLAGQSEEQQHRDQSECHHWAVGQTGFDPNTPPPQPSRYASAPRSSGSSTGFLGVGGDKNLVGGSGNVLSDAGTGAAMGAIGGAIAGDAGAGAAIGAATSALFGAISRSSRENERAQFEREQQQRIAEEQAQYERERQHGMKEFRRAFGTCMSARDYRVQ